MNQLGGPKGGYKLARSTETISLADILIAADEGINLTCGNGATCSDTNPCLTHSLWNNLSHEFFQFLNNKKLSDLINTRYVQTMATQQDVSLIGDIPVQINR